MTDFQDLSSWQSYSPFNSNKVNLSWSFSADNNFIKFNITANTEGWFGLGLSPAGLMKNSDMYIMYIFTNGSIYFKDTFATGRTTPKEGLKVRWRGTHAHIDSNFVSEEQLIKYSDPSYQVDENDEVFLRGLTFSVFNFQAWRNSGSHNNLQSFSFIRKTEPNYDMRINLSDECLNKFVFAFKESNDFEIEELTHDSLEALGAHSNEVSKDVKLCGLNTINSSSSASTAASSDIEINSSLSSQILNSEHSSDSTGGTASNSKFNHLRNKTFYFDIHFPENNIIKKDKNSWADYNVNTYPIVLNQTGVDLNHYSAHITKIEAIISNEGLLHHMILFGGLNNQTNEETFLYLKSISKLETPSNAGIPFGNGFNKLLRINTHYYNKAEVQNQYDASGFRIHYTFNLREHDYGIIVSGRGTSNFIIPINSTSFIVNGTCSKNCYNDIYWDKPIYIHTYLLHGHFYMKSISAEIIYEDGSTNTEMRIDNFDPFNHDFTQAAFPIKFSRGDTMNVHCEFNTQGAGSIRGGARAEDEMCLTYMGYYPRYNFSPHYCFADPVDAATVDKTMTGQKFSCSVMSENKKVGLFD